MKIIVATDSFKGCLSSQNIGLIIQHALHDEIPNAQVDVIPMSDGGEGFVDSIVFATQGKKVPVQVKGPFGDSIVAYYGILGDGKTIAIEVAQIVGLYQISRDQLAPLDATSFGIGEVMLHALDRGYRKFIFGLGGSATNDGGIGMLQALGGMFLDEHGKQVEPTAKGVSKVAELMLEGLDPRIGQSELVIACDVVNSLCGMNGATAVFGPQKGVREEEIEALDQSLEKFALLIEQKKNATFKDLPGAGAAGGLGFALLSMQASMRSGAEIVSELVGYQINAKRQIGSLQGRGAVMNKPSLEKSQCLWRRPQNSFVLTPFLYREALIAG